jgi:MFS family permease
MIAPTVLAVVNTTFPEGKPREQAMGVVAAMSGGGVAIGLIAGGLLTSYVSWRWVLFVNVPVGLITGTLAVYALQESARSGGAIDLPGAITGTGGVGALVYGLSNASTDQSGVSHWSDTKVIVALAAAAVLLVSFVIIEWRSRSPLLPLRIIADRTRAGSYLALLCLDTAMFGIFFFLTLFVQDVLGYTPLKDGIAFLPFAAVLVLVAVIVSNVIGRTGPKPPMLLGGLLTAGGMFWFSRLTEQSSYVNGLIGPMLITAAGLGLIFVPITLTGTARVSPEDAGAASSLINTAQQVGGAIGLAALGTVVWTVVSNDIMAHVGHAVAPAPSLAMYKHALTAGFARGFLIASAIALLALLITAVTIKVRKDEIQADGHTATG